eukprot:4902719-Pleurochrysis_carterae.AAC.1
MPICRSGSTLAEVVQLTHCACEQRSCMSEKRSIVRRAAQSARFCILRYFLDIHAGLWFSHTRVRLLCCGCVAVSVSLLARLPCLRRCPSWPA